MPKSIRAVRGMNDLLPPHSKYWLDVEDTLRAVLTSYGYHHIRTPIVESTALFARSIGEHTDIVEKEMYTFLDRNGDSLTLRPEGTASCVRSGIEHGLLHNKIQRLWTMGPMFRHERPQKGRYRQFHQCSVETYGMSGAAIDAELILITARMWQQLNVSDSLSLEINSIGSADSRAQYRHALVDFLKSYEADLDEDSKRRIKTNPLRILDSKIVQTQEILSKAPRLDQFIDSNSQEQFESLQLCLQTSGINYQVNPFLIRGLDYYNDTVFEWTTTKLGSQSAVCGGGRYDLLVEQLGGKPTPASGFAIGLERLYLLLETVGGYDGLESYVDVFIVVIDLSVMAYALFVGETLRSSFPKRISVVNCTGASFKSQMKALDKSGAKVALLLGEHERDSQQVTVKYQQGEKTQVQCDLKNLSSLLQNIF